MDHTFWYLTRASGFVSYVLLFVSLLFGLSMTTDLSTRLFQRYQIYDLHRFLSLFTLAFTAFHVLIVLPDRFIGFTLWELLVPTASPYRPLYMTLGLVSFYLMVLTVGSFYARHYVSYRGWRLLHYATFAVFVTAAAHGIGAGSDTDAAWAPYLYAGTSVAVFNLTVYRVLKGSARGLQARTARLAVDPGQPRRG